MKICIKKSQISGRVIVPPSKSISHRAIICAGLAKGVSIIRNVEFSNDIIATLNCIRVLGAKYNINKNEIIIEGISNKTQINKATFDCNESGSTYRFMIPIANVLNIDSTYIGSKRLMERPIDVYEEIFKNQNIKCDKRTENNKVIRSTQKLESLYVEGKSIKAGIYDIKGDISSQFITGLMYGLPLLDGDSVLNIIEPVVSKPYIDITIKILKDFGINIIEEKKNSYKIKGNQKFIAREYNIEGDYTNASYLDALNLIGDVEIIGLNEATVQGDKIYKKLFEKIKTGFDIIDVSNCIDLAPILFVYAAFYEGMKFVGTKTLSLKESDRVKAMQKELSKYGIVMSVKENEVVVEKSTIHLPDTIIDSHNDHRILMAMMILALKEGAIIENSEAINKSFPSYFEKIKKLGGIINYE